MSQPAPHRTPARTPVLAALSAALLLASCGAPTRPDATALPASTAAGVPTPPEATAPARMTDLSDTALPAPLNAQALDKSTPLILVHGLGGFGRDEALGLRYWGGLNDVQQDLRGQGYSVFTASMGPVSSNWDRAAELYAQIKGAAWTTARRTPPRTGTPARTPPSATPASTRSGTRSTP
ncbi:esterase/lipase family protein [Deinococcus aquaticus]|uniref:esterase/lipase family protein n=1 Tax=Deinococcus aquaticus TaxID=328692 RepID=UPI003620103A